MAFKIGDRIIDAGYKGTIVGIFSQKRSLVSYDRITMRHMVSNVFLEKITQTPKKKPRISYWK